MTDENAVEDGGQTAAELMHQVLNAPLYSGIDLPWDSLQSELRNLRLDQGRRDMYCPSCGQTATWMPLVMEELTARAKSERAQRVLSASALGKGSLPVTNWSEDFELRLMCTRKHHIARYIFTVRMPPKPLEALQAGVKPAPAKLIKLGQWPALTDFQLGDLSDFEEGMSKSQRREFVRGINSAAHGFSVAACVYFRRVFESVLAEARDSYLSQNSLQEWPEFDQARTDQRIRLLAGYLPTFMTEHPELYGVLSLGVHELSEQQCAKELPMLRQAIELIIEDRVTEARRNKQREQVSKLLAQRVNHHMNPSRHGG